MKKYKVIFTKEYEYSEEYLKIIFKDSIKSFEEQAIEVASWDLNKDLEFIELNTDKIFNSKVEVNDDLSELLNTPIIGGLSKRALTCLKGCNISTIGQLTEMNSYDLLRHKNMGLISFREIKKMLHIHNLKFKNEK